MKEQITIVISEESSSISDRRVKVVESKDTKFSKIRLVPVAFEDFEDNLGHIRLSWGNTKIYIFPNTGKRRVVREQISLEPRVLTRLILFNSPRQFRYITI